ncbi:MAG: hypothetical protein CVV17_03300 [Gammaproteobacteria bacterium HGW-Gammaproteobacteria-7]|nr:MAG: hypothetical protein CVV17_03300 [Gammaproteobacteria bacterium HGW-Gammaproteobacteria-7]
MIDHIKWAAQRDSAGQVIPRCWLTDTGYTVTKAPGLADAFTVRRPGDTEAFAYTDKRADVPLLIAADMQESQVSDAAQARPQRCWKVLLPARSPFSMILMDDQDDALTVARSIWPEAQVQ